MVKPPSRCYSVTERSVNCARKVTEGVQMGEPSEATTSLSKIQECRSCGGTELFDVLSLGSTPVANTLPYPDQIEPDASYPLGIVACADCSLVQLGHALGAADIFTDDYPYFSSVSEALCAHAEAYVADLRTQRSFGPDSLVVEVASNDGYLLKHFVAAGIRTLGVDPSPGPAAAARANGVPTLVDFFSATLARTIRNEHGAADVIIANNVLAHVPDLNDVVAGFAELLADDGVVTIENPYVRVLVDNLVFDTIYHEHYCYFSCTAIDHLARRHGLHLNDVEFLPTIHGGSLRWSLQKFEARTERCALYLSDEAAIGIDDPTYYATFANRVDFAGKELKALLEELHADGKRVAAYGAAAKGATLLNSQGIGRDLVEYVVDLNPHKQDRAIPGCRIPILPPTRLGEDRPDFLLLLAWNYKDEIRKQQHQFLANGGQLIVPLPTPVIEPLMANTTEASAPGGAPGAGERMHALITRLFPICRSLTGDGVRATLAAVAEEIAPTPLERTEVPTGTKVLDWEVPDEWNLREAYIQDAAGHRIVDTAVSNLHVMSYSEPVDIELDRAELDTHLHSLPDRPHAIPYRTSYYARRWGFCLSDAQRQALPDGLYRAVVDATLEPGSLTYGEAVLPGSSDREILIVAHVCHPSLCNDNLAGVSVAVELLRTLAQRSSRRHTVRFLFAPVTLGSISWLSRECHESGAVGRIAHGLVLTGLGDRSRFTYKRSRTGDRAVDRAAAHVLGHHEADHRVIDFSPYGYDERQLCSPGFDLPVGRLCRATHGEHAEYHTSDDDLTFVHPDSLQQSLDVVTAIVDVLEGDATYVNTAPYGEPQLGRRGLFRNLGGVVPPSTEMGLLWLLSQSDGTNSLLDIANRAGLPFPVLRSAADALLSVELLRRVDTPARPGP